MELQKMNENELRAEIARLRAAIARKVSHDDNCALVQDPSNSAACDCAEVGRQLRSELRRLRAENARLRAELESR